MLKSRKEHRQVIITFLMDLPEQTITTRVRLAPSDNGQPPMVR